MSYSSLILAIVLQGAALFFAAMWGADMEDRRPYYIALALGTGALIAACSVWA